MKPVRWNRAKAAVAAAAADIAAVAVVVAETAAIVVAETVATAADAAAGTKQAIFKESDPIRWVAFFVGGGDAVLAVSLEAIPKVGMGHVTY